MKCLLLSFLFIPIISIAQQDIPNAQAGKCYAKCLLPFTEKDVQDKAEGKAVQISMAYWIEVLCNDKITSKIIRQIKLELVDKEYLGYQYLDNKTYDKEVKIALTKYQRYNKLPIGNLNFETFKHMGIRY